MLRAALLSTLVISPLLLASCGGSGSPEGSVTVTRAASHPDPPASAVSGLLGKVADVPEAADRIGYVAPERLTAIREAVAPASVTRAVMGDAGLARLTRSTAYAAQLGRVTVLADADGSRRIVGAGGELADQLASTTPPSSILAPETFSAVQSCLGDPAAEVILGPGKLGPTSAIGASLIDDADAPAGPKLRICAAPHYVRDLHAVQERLKRTFAKQGADVGEDEIGEREIVRAVIALDQLDAAAVNDVLSGGAALRRLALG